MPIERCQLFGWRSLVNVPPPRSANAQHETIPPGSGLPKKFSGSGSHACGSSGESSSARTIRVTTGDSFCKPPLSRRNRSSSTTTRSFILQRCSGRHTVADIFRTPDLYRVESEVKPLQPFSCLAFPFSQPAKTALRQPIFGDELVTSFVRVNRCHQHFLQRGFRHTPEHDCLAL
jgi:hypothetical protein